MSRVIHVVDGEASESDTEIEIGTSPVSFFIKLCILVIGPQKVYLTLRFNIKILNKKIELLKEEPSAPKRSFSTKL